jgi:hypothetical protein
MKLLDILKEAAEEDFGKVVFGSKKDEPEFARMQGAKPGSEPNTDKEQKLLSLLRRWVQGPQFAVKDLYKLSSIIKALAPKYPRILKPKTPNGTTLFRGLKNVSPEILEVVKASKPEDWVLKKGMMLLKNPINYTPRTEVQSWTNEFLSAMEFATEGILITKQTDDFYFNQEVFDELYGRPEEEVLHLGTKYDSPIYFGFIKNSKLSKKFKTKFDKVPMNAKSSGSEVEKLYGK